MMRQLVAAALALCVLVLAPSKRLSAPQDEASGSIRGRVVYQNGKIAPGAVVSAFKENQLRGHIPMAHADNEGHFVITHLEMGVEYSLCASKQYEGYWIPYMLPFGLPTGGQCTRVKAGTVSEVDVVLAPKGGTLEGEIRDARSGDPISTGKAIIYRPLKFLRGEWTLVNPGEATYVPSAEAAVEINGHFKIIGLPTGNYFLKIKVPGRQTWYFNNQVSDIAAQPLGIRGGLTRKIVVRIR
jgi:hypothetical protein